MTRIEAIKPVLRGWLERDADGSVQLHQGAEIFDLEPPEGVSPDQLAALLDSMDGRSTAAEVAQRGGLDEGTLRQVLEPALAAGLIDDSSEPVASTGLAALSRLEGTLDRLVQELIFEGPFWTALLNSPEELPPSVYHGFGLENWFFLFHENEFDAAVLSYPVSAQLRSMLNDFYQEEHRHDDIVLRAFEPLGITKADLLASRPLPTTTALIRLLSWWARTDPLFFMATIGILEGRLDPEGDASETGAYDSFLVAADRAGLSPDFVEPLRRHAKVNAAHDHSAVSRELFAHVAGVDAETEQRWHGKAHLFVEAYAAFYEGVLAYYGDPDRPLLRRTAEREG
jgi:hypothetical protein